MTVEQFEKAEVLMKEKREIEKFLSVFKESSNNRVIGTKKASTSLDQDRPIEFWFGSNSYLKPEIIKAMENRITAIDDMLQQI